MNARRRWLGQALPTNFSARYGSWALVAGASEGLGAAYSRALAQRGINLVLVARRQALLEELRNELRGAFGVEVCYRNGDLADRAFLTDIEALCSSLELGLIVYNATHAPIGEFTSASDADLTRITDVNVRAPLALLRALLPPMVARGKGAVILMTSLAGNQGSPKIAAYAATKAFTRVFAEGLWYELRGRGIDVVACSAGAVRTPGYSEATVSDAPGTLDPDEVAEKALNSLGRGPVVVPGLVNRAANVFMSRVLPRRTAISIMAGSTTSLAPAKQPMDGP